jgi:hypothetical protein
MLQNQFILATIFVLLFTHTKKKKCFILGLMQQNRFILATISFSIFYLIVFRLHLIVLSLRR